MTEQEFLALGAQGYNRIPLTIELFADLDTPLSVYLKLAHGPYTYLFESVVGGERFGRYSFIGLPARTVLNVRQGRVEVHTDGVLQESHDGDPLAFVEAYQARFRAAPLARPLRFTGGLVGYFGYDTVRYIEKKLAATQLPDVLDVPDILLMLSEELAIFDSLAGKLYLIVYADPAQAGSYQVAQQRLQRLQEQLRTPAVLPAYTPSADKPEPVSEIGEARYLEAVARCKEYIVEGDIFQVQIGQRISLPFDAPPLNLYRAVRSLNPSPYMFFVDCGAFQIVGASPEILVRQEGEQVTVRPIAGTRPRGDTPEADLAWEQELINDPKERAEHVMLIDLGRNDIGRVAEIGTVKVTETMVIERYSHVMHIVSNVEGTLKPGMGPIGLLRATFPAGTLTGTPKVRAMEVIDELEPSRRSIYGGAVGYLGFNGNMDLAIAIRTGVIKNQTLYVQAAAGVVADSVPIYEWKETNNKARAMLLAAEQALAGMDAHPV